MDPLHLKSLLCDRFNFIVVVEVFHHGRYAHDGDVSASRASVHVKKKKSGRSREPMTREPKLRREVLAETEVCQNLWYLHLPLHRYFSIPTFSNTE